MRRAWVAWLGGTVVLLAGCGSGGGGPISPACTDDTAVIVKALGRAPAAVTLPDGTRLADCISRGTSDADLQSVGLAFHTVAEDLRVRAREGGDAGAATGLGYLIGATRKGAAHTNGVMAELQRRVELVGGRLETESPGIAAAVERGLAAGEKLG